MPVLTKDLNFAKNRVTHVNITLGIYGQSGATICVGQVQDAQEMACYIQNLNPRVAHIQHEQFTARDHDLGGESELSRTFTTAADSQFANKLPALVHNNDHVPLSVADINMSRRSIDCDPGWAGEVRLSTSQSSKIMAKLSCRVVDEYVSIVLVAHI